MENLIFTGVSLDELLSRIEQIIEAKLVVTKTPDNQSSDFITRKEVAQLLKISLPTLHVWTRQGWLKSYKMGNRVLYKLEEIQQAIGQVFNLKNKKTKL